MERKEHTVLSKGIRAGRRTYFFDVKTTKNNEKYLTLTESIRKMDPDGIFFYEKHKIFLYKEDFAKFQAVLAAMVNFIETGFAPDESLLEEEDNVFDIEEDLEA